MATRKKLLATIAVLASVNALAGSVDYLSQQDAEYMAHPAMVGKIGVSGAYYNPAGTVWLEDGTYIQLNNQTHLKKYSMTANGRKFESDKASPVVPSFQLVTKKGDNAFFFHAGAIAGGGTVEYDGGLGRYETITHDSLILKALGVSYLGGSTFKGQSYYVAVQGGIARKVSDSWSLALGMRVIDAERKLKGKGYFKSDFVSKISKNSIDQIKYDIDSERTAMGVTGIIGANYHPNEKFNLGLRYETETRLNFETREKNIRNGLQESFAPLNNLKPGLGNFAATIIENHLAHDRVIREWNNGQKGRRNLPAMAAAGMSYKATDRLTLLASGNYYFIKEAGDDFGAYDGYDNGYEISFGIDYELTPKWTLMTGYQYTDTGANKNTYKDTDYALDANMYSIGAKYKYSENLAFMATYSYVDYKTATAIDNVTYKKHVDAFGVAMTYKF